MILLFEKCKQQEKRKKNPLLFFFDIDATISTYSLSGFTANKKNAHLLRANAIPYILITGRPNWCWFNEWEMKLYGLYPPDAVIIGNGTSLLWRNSSGNMEKDTEWNNLIFSNWHAKKIENICTNFHFSFPVFKKKLYEDKPLFLYRVHNASVNTLWKEIGQLKKLLPKNVRVDISESSLFKNTDRVFSGGIFVVPETCGKAGAIRYMLDNLSRSLGTSPLITNYMFGDASIDIPMLSLPSNKTLLFKSYLVDPTPLAKKEAKKYPEITVIHEKGPQAIANIMNQELRIVQNSKLRIVEKIFEPLFDTILHKKLLPNDISFLGLEKVIQGIDEIEKGKKIQGFCNYTFATFTDVLDGIRARRTENSSQIEAIPGQLVDGFCDRAKEFYQVFTRAKKRFHKQFTNEAMEPYLLTFLSAISCMLPCIARAQAEAKGIIVKERDEKGGSSIDRTKLLFQSLFYHSFGNDKKSFKFDKEIYERNIATYKNRIHCLQKSPLKQDDFSKNSFQTDAHERFLLYIQLLQETNQLIEKTIHVQKILLEKYLKWQKEYISDYLSINVRELKKQYMFKTYDALSLQRIKK